MTNWDGMRVTVIGAARQGQAAARFLLKQGALVTINDQRPAEQLKPARQALEGLPIDWEMGGHPISLLDRTDLLCLSGGIPLSLPLIQEAGRRGIPLTNDTQVFLEVVPCKTIGITGSSGKTTTTSLAGTIAQRTFTAQGRNAWVGGNIGDPLLNYVEQMKKDDMAILEISSFQLDQMTSSTDIAAVLNITPNHLDRHKNMAAYIAAKSRLVENQGRDSVTVLGRDDAGAWNLKDKVHGRLYSFGFSPVTDGTGMTYLEGNYQFSSPEGSENWFDQSSVHLRGEHNQLNVMAACLVSWAAGISVPEIVSGVGTFQGVPHRLEFIRNWGGAAWYNDSIATAPERTMAAIRSFSEPIVLLLGGRDKDLPWDSLVDLVQDRVRQVVLFGESAEKINQAFSQIPTVQRHFSIYRCAGLKDAVLCAAGLVQPGEVVLLSPGGTSFDEFKDFEERGERFQQWVLGLS